MTRTEHDLRDALHELERRADDHGAPSTADLLARVDDGRDDNHGRYSETRPSRFPRWVAPAAAAAVVAAAAITAAAVHAGDSGSGQHVGGSPSGAPTVSNPVSPFATSSVAARSASASPSASVTGSASPTANTGGTAAAAASILDDAAGKLAATSWSPPASKDYFYVRTNLATTWTSVSGAKAGRGHTSSGGTIVPGCREGHIVSSGESGSCTLNDVPHYRRDAPTDAAAWDAYLEAIAPGAKAADAQGKIIVQVLHQDLLAPKAAAALLRFTSSCPGLHTLSVRPVAGQQLDGVTCTSMSNGSYGLAFDATTREFVGFVGVDQSGVQDSTAEIVAKTGIVTSLGDTP